MKNNKGFSLVELIIVIAILGILAAALTPQIMKYIEKANIAHDNQTCDAIYDVVNCVLAEERFYQVLARNGNHVTDEIILHFTPDDVYYCTYNCFTRNDQEYHDMCDFVIEVEKRMGDKLVAPKQSGKNGYTVGIKVNTEIETSPSGDQNRVYSVGNVYVKTLSLDSDRMSEYFCRLGFDDVSIW